MSASPLPVSRPATPAAKSSAELLRERIARGMEAADRLHSPGAAAVLRRALETRTERRAAEIAAEAEAMLAKCESRPLPVSRPAPAPPPRPGPAIKPVLPTGKGTHPSRDRGVAGAFGRRDDQEGKEGKKGK